MQFFVTVSRFALIVNISKKIDNWSEVVKAEWDKDFLSVFDTVKRRVNCLMNFVG